MIVKFLKEGWFEALKMGDYVNFDSRSKFGKCKRDDAIGRVMYDERGVVGIEFRKYLRYINVDDIDADNESTIELQEYTQQPSITINIEKVIINER